MPSRPFRYVLARQWWRGPIVVRFGPSSQVYHLLLAEDGHWKGYVIAGDPRAGPTLAYEVEKPMRSVEDREGRAHDLMTMRGRVSVRPRTSANPTKETPSFLEVLERGEGEVMEEEPGWRKLRLGSQAYLFRREEPGSSFWEVMPSPGPQVSKGSRPLLLRGIAELIPPHRVYVEIWGSASAPLLFSKEPAPVEILHAPSGAMGQAMRLLRDMDERDLAGLEPGGPLDGWIGALKDLPARRQRLNGVQICSGEPARLVRKADREDTFFLIQPEDEGQPRPARARLQLWKALLSARGKFLYLSSPAAWRAMQQAGAERPSHVRAFRCRLAHPEAGEPQERWLFMNYAPRLAWQGRGELIKAVPERQIVYGIVLKPHVPDAHGDIFTPEEIERAAHAYLARSRLLDWRHERLLPPSQGVPVESFIAPVDFSWQGKRIPAGSWVLATHIQDPDLWKEILSGKIRAYSIRGFGLRRPVA